MSTLSINEDIRSSFLPGEESVLRAIISPIRTDILRSGKTLTEDEGSFYIPSGFSWRKSVKEFFDSYYAICYRKQIEPSNLDADYKKAVKIPYVHFDTVTSLHDGIVSTVRQFHIRDIKPFDRLSSNPTVEEIDKCRKEYIKDKDFYQYFSLLLQIDSALREYVEKLDELIGAYNVRFGCFRRALRNAKNESELIKSRKEATDKLSSLLQPYIKRLKSLGALPSSWTYDIKKLPISDFHRSTLKGDEIKAFEKYWSEDVLPLASLRAKKEREAEEHAELLRKARLLKEEEEKKRAEAESKRREEAARRAKPASPVSPSPSRHVRSKPTRVKLSRPSLWSRFDKWVSGIGDWFAYKMDDISDWMMTAWVYFFIAYVIIGIIVVWVNEGFFSAVIAVFVILFLVGLLGGLIETIAGIIALVVKYVTYVPLFVLRGIFYRGWTLVLLLLSGCGYLTYLILKAKFII